MAADPQLLIARIGKPHGLHGEVTVQSHTDDPEARFAIGETFATQAPPGSGVPRQLTLSSARLHRGIWLLGFQEIPDRSGAQSLRETRLFVDAASVTSSAQEHDDAEGWYEDELVGLAVVTVGGEPVGEVAGLHTGVAQDLLVVRLTRGGEVLVPFVEAIVPEVDVQGGRVVIDPPAGLLELGQGE